MIRNAQRSLLSRRRWPVAAAVLGAALAVAGTIGLAAASPSATPGRAASLSSQIRQDKAYVAKQYNGCAGFALHGKCPFAVASTGNGVGGDLIAVELRWYTMDACNRGLVYLFDGTTFAETTHRLAPFSVGGVDVVHGHGARTFAVTYWVSKSKFTSCAANGNGGTDVYTYRWNGTKFVKTSGTLPRPPKVIVGSPQDS